MNHDKETAPNLYPFSLKFKVGKIPRHIKEDNVHIFDKNLDLFDNHCL